METELFGQTCHSDSALEQVAVRRVDPRIGTSMEEHEFICAAANAQPCEERHSLVGQIDMPRVIPFASPDIDTEDCPADVPDPQASEFTDAAASVERAKNELAQVGSAASDQTSALVAAQGDYAWSVEIRNVVNAAPSLSTAATGRTSFGPSQTVPFDAHDKRRL
jgi:hypothetical protein